MILIWFAFLVLAQETWSQDEDDGPYRGNLIGKLNSYHHQVTGEVYAVNDSMLLLVNFNYDGTGDDTFFWAGDSARPGPQGFIIPDQHGKTNILERYFNADVWLRLPEGKRVSRLKWFAVYDVGSQNAFGDVAVPDEFAAPAPAAAAALAGPGVASAPLLLPDAATILIPDFHFDGEGEVYFWVGVGPQPSSRGFKVPDEYGYLEPLRAYRGEAVRLRLPGALSLLALSWLALWDAAAGRARAAVLLPERPNVPPAPARPHPHKTALPACRQLHRDLQVAWELFGNQITVQLAGKLHTGFQIEEDEYMAFGISGSERGPQMQGADVAVAAFDGRLRRGLLADYNVTARAPCVQVLGQWRGVCRDELVGGQDSNQLLTAARSDGLTVVTYRRTLQPAEAMDREWATDRPLQALWALGALDAGEPAFHRAWPRAPLALLLAQQPPPDDCFHFTIGSEPAPAAWDVAELFDPALRVFEFRLAPSGARRGAAGRGAAAGGAALAWLVNGQLAPDLQLRRGLHYTFKVFGGNDPHSAEEYHPLIVSAEPRGGLEQLAEPAQRAARVLAGVAYSRRGRLSPGAAGPLCLAKHAPAADRRRDDDFATFRAFNRSLTWSCAPGEPAVLHVAPNDTWPDLVYYNSFTHRGMGGRIFVVDRHRRNLNRKSSAARAAPGPLALAPPALALALALAPALAPALALALALVAAARL